MSSGGGPSGQQPSRLLSRRVTRVPTWTMGSEGPSGEADDAEESELVPSSLADIVRILRAANEIEAENPRVAYLCRFTAFEKAHTMDPNSNGRGVRQFKTYLLHRLEKDEAETKRTLASSDAKEIQLFFQEYCRKYLEKDHEDRKPEEMARHYQIASVLYDVLKTVAPEGVRAEVDQIAKGVEKEKASYSHYNILPLNISGSTQPIMEIPEIKAAVKLLRKIENLPTPTIDVPQNMDRTSVPEEVDRPAVHDMIDWLGIAFGFQKGNVENQKEHLIMLLANIDMRKGNYGHQSDGRSYLIHTNTATYLKDKIFQNYNSWCEYLHQHSNVIIPPDAPIQFELVYIGLYLLIWGEASNVRFMPECLCYIFHQMAKDLNVILSDGRDSFQPPLRGKEAFLEIVIEPIYKILQKEATRSKRGTVSHSKWRNDDDLNEYFWSKKCFKELRWPLNPEADFFLEPTKPRNGNEAMVTISWSPSGSLFAIFEPDIFRNVLTIFITAAFLDFLQATLEIILNWKAWRSLESSEKFWYMLKFVVAIAWLIILPATYFGSVQDPRGLVKIFRKWIGNSQIQKLYSFAIVVYMLPNIFGALLSIFLPISRYLERSNFRIIRFFMWWTQPKLYGTPGMYEGTCSVLKYVTFWILLLICKLAFSFYVEISPLVAPTRIIMFLGTGDYGWHEFFPYCVILALWTGVLHGHTNMVCHFLHNMWRS